MLESFRRRLIVSIVLTIPILLFSRGFQAIVGFTTPRPPGLDAVLIALSLGVYVYGGGPFLEGLVREVKSRRPAMMTLVGGRHNRRLGLQHTGGPSRRGGVAVGVDNVDRHHATRSPHRDEGDHEGFRGP